VKNSKIKTNTVFFPDNSNNIELFAGLIDKNEPTKDLYVIFFSENEIDLNRIYLATETYVKNESNYKFDEVINLMDKFDYSTVIINTIPKR
jgi:hypothetical protein